MRAAKTSPKRCTTSRSRSGVRYAPHPAFTRDANGKYRYHSLSADESAGKRTPFDFADPGTRELTAHDYVYSIRRLATPRIKSASYSLMAEHIVGLKEYGDTIAAADKELRTGLDLRAATCHFSTFANTTWPVHRLWTITHCAFG